MEISFGVKVSAGLSFHVDPGTVITQEMLQDAINRVNRALDKGELILGGDIEIALHITDFNPDTVERYDSESGESSVIKLGEAA